MLHPEDRSALETLVGDLGRSTVTRALQMLIRDLPAQLAELRTQATANEPATFKRLAHNLKGRCGMLGLKVLRESVYRLEQASFEPTPARRLALLHELDVLAEELIPNLSNFLKELATLAD
jgi:HPt (histidine-containing phosphotransfer) domain-containing protein